MKIPRKVLYWLVFLAAMLLLVEGGSRLAMYKVFGGQNPRFEYSGLWRIALMQSHSGRKVTPKTPFNVTMPAAVYDRVKGWTLSPSARVPFEYGMFSTNAHGLRGVQEFPYRKPQGSRRIIVVGDSYAMGAENDDQAIFPYLMGQMLPGYEVLNFGVGGYGHDQMLLKLEEEGPAYEPDIVLLLYLGCDNPRNLMTFRPDAKPRYVVKNGALRLVNSPVPSPAEIARTDAVHSYLLDALGFIAYRIKAEKHLTEKDEAQVTTALIRQMSKVSARMKAVFVIVAFTDDISNGRFDPTKIDAGSIPCILVDTRGYPGEYFRGHWNARGHAVVADQIVRGLREKKLVPAVQPQARGAELPR